MLALWTYGFKSHPNFKANDDGGGTPLSINPKDAVLILDIKAVRVEFTISWE